MDDLDRTEKLFREYYETHDDNDYTLLGELELFDDYTMEHVLGELNLKKETKKVIVELYTRDEGDNIPHVHLYNDHFRSAIRLDINQYFLHGKHKKKLNDDQTKLFDSFMREMPKGTFVTRWQLAVSIFNMLHPKNMITIKEQPDYTKLNYTVNLKDEVESKKKGKKKK